MYRLLYHLSNMGKLRGNGFMPIPTWLKNIFARYPMQQRILAYARLLKDQKVYYGVQQEYACANAVTGLLEMIDPSFFGSHGQVNRIDSTIILTNEMEVSDRFIELKTPIDGCIVMSTTGTGNGKLANGHTGVLDNGRIWSNNSYTGRWTTYWTLQAWKAHYELKGGFKTRYFLPIVSN